MTETDTQPSISSEEFLRTGRDVRISHQEGFLCKVRMKALFDIPPDELFLLLTSENNSSVFSSIDKTIRKDLVSENSKERVMYVEQAATVGTLMFKKQFITACYVTEYPQKLSAEFSLAKPGIMASFQGHWSLTPVSPEAYRKLTSLRHPQEPWERGNSSSCAHSHPAAACSGKMKTLMYVDQDVGPAAARKVPPVFHGFLRRICASAVLDVHKDLTVVAALLRQGVTVETMLHSRVHGRRGLKRGLLQKGRRSTSLSRNGLDFEGTDKYPMQQGDASSTYTSSPIRSYACDVADLAPADWEDEAGASVGSMEGGTSCSVLSSATEMCSSPAQLRLKSFRILDFGTFEADDDVV